MPIVPSRLATLEQAARVVDLSTRPLRTYVEQGQLIGYKRPGRDGLLFVRDEVKRVCPPKYGENARIIELPANIVLLGDKR